jgi:hypothetical protein
MNETNEKDSETRPQPKKKVRLIFGKTFEEYYGKTYDELKEYARTHKAIKTVPNVRRRDDGLRG